MVETSHFCAGSAAILTAPCLICMEQEMWRWCGEVTRGSPTDDSTQGMSEAIFPALANGKFEYFLWAWLVFFLPTTGVENGKIGSCERLLWGKYQRRVWITLCKLLVLNSKCVTHLMVVDAEKWFLSLLRQVLSTLASALTSLTKILPSDSRTVVHICVALQERLDWCWLHLCFHGCFLLCAFLKICLERFRKTAVIWTWSASKFYAGFWWFVLNSMKSFVD